MDDKWTNPENWISPTLRFKNRHIGSRMPSNLDTWVLISSTRMWSSSSEIEVIAPKTYIRSFVCVNKNIVINSIPCVYVPSFGVEYFSGLKSKTIIWDNKSDKKQPDHDMPKYYAQEPRMTSDEYPISIFWLVKIEHLKRYNSYLFTYKTEVEWKGEKVKVEHTLFRPVLNEEYKWEYLETKQGLEYE